MAAAYDKTQLSRVDALLKSFVDNGEIPGAALSVTFRGEEILRSMHGMANLETGAKIQDDTIYRVYSMTKVITVIAALILYERGLYKMYDPISKFIPACANPSVYEADGIGGFRARPAKREIFIRDLFTMTSGIPYPGDDTQTGRDYAAGPERATMRELVESEMARVPLVFDPGERWMYGMSLDVIGVLVEILSGMTLGQFMRREIFDPLGMKDASFHITPERTRRFAGMYRIDGGKFERAELSMDAMFAHDSRFEMGGGGLTMTLGDYKRITDLLVNNGALGGVRILSRKTIDLMATPHLTDAQALTHDWDTQRGYNYGLGVRVLTDKALSGYNGTVGEFGWDGMAGTYMNVDREEGLSVVFMTQILPGSHYVFLPRLIAAVYAGL